MERKVQRASLELLVIKGFEEKMERRVLKGPEVSLDKQQLG